MGADGGFLSVKGSDGSANTIKLMNGTHLKINGKTYTVENGTIFCDKQKVTGIEVSDSQKNMLFIFANADTENGGYGYFNEEDMSWLRSIIESQSPKFLTSGELVQIDNVTRKENFRISTPNSREYGEQLSRYHAGEAEKNNAYAKKHWFRNRVLGITRQEYESNPNNKIDY